MTDAELKKLNRTDLLELLLAQEKENESLRQQLETARNQLEDRRIALEETGNIADASLRLNGVFQAAQEAADQFLMTIRTRAEKQESRCAVLEAEAKEKADRLLQETEERCAAMTAAAEAESQAYWDEVSRRMEEFYNAHAGLRELLAVGGRKGSAAE